MGRNPRQSPAHLASKLLYIRTELLGLSQNQMIRRLGFSGELIQSHISAYEQENEKIRREPPLVVLLQYARAAGVSVEALIDDKIDLVGELSEVRGGIDKRAPMSSRKKSSAKGKRIT